MAFEVVEMHHQKEGLDVERVGIFAANINYWISCLSEWNQNPYGFSIKIQGHEAS